MARRKAERPGGGVRRAQTNAVAAHLTALRRRRYRHGAAPCWCSDGRSSSANAPRSRRRGAWPRRSRIAVIRDEQLIFGSTGANDTEGREFCEDFLAITG